MNQVRRHVCPALYDLRSYNYNCGETVFAKKHIAILVSTSLCGGCVSVQHWIAWVQQH